MGVLFVVALLIKLIMACAYPIGALAGVLLGGGEPVSRGSIGRPGMISEFFG